LIIAIDIIDIYINIITYWAITPLYFIILHYTLLHIIITIDIISWLLIDTLLLLLHI
jgi:hypothetical protein